MPDPTTQLLLTLFANPLTGSAGNPKDLFGTTIRGPVTRDAITGSRVFLADQMLDAGGPARGIFSPGDDAIILALSRDAGGQQLPRSPNAILETFDHERLHSALDFKQDQPNQVLGRIFGTSVPGMAVNQSASPSIIDAVHHNFIRDALAQEADRADLQRIPTPNRQALEQLSMLEKIFSSIDERKNAKSRKQ